MIRPARPLAVPRRVAMISVHTSPLDQPGTGDAGGMNVYIAEVAQRLAAPGRAVEVFTRATRRPAPQVELAPGVLVHNIPAGPYDGLTKEDLPGQLCAMTAGVLRREAARRERLVRPDPLPLLALRAGRLAGQGALGRAAGAHDAHDGPGQEPATWRRATDPSRRCGSSASSRWSMPPIGWSRTPRSEAHRSVSALRRRPPLMDVVLPGVDLDAFPRGGSGCRPGRALGYRPDELVVLFVGRIQPLKAPDLILRAQRRAPAARTPGLASRMRVVVLRRPVRVAGTEHPTALADLAAELECSPWTSIPRPSRGDSARRYAAADVAGRAVALGVLRTRGAGGAGVRHPGSRGEGRRPAGRGRRRGVRGARGRP